MPDRKLYAVLSGINAYPPPVTALRGCLHDVRAWESYLEESSGGFELHKQILEDGAVTKAGLLAAWRQALEAASEKDVVFLFYSGHGTRESADDVFSGTEPDAALESLVCIDSVAYQGSQVTFDLLSDKEIHYTLSTYTKPGTHVVTAFDCCHSGGVTRNMLLGQGADMLERRYVPTERLSFVAPKRKWQDFAFGQSIQRNVVAEKGWWQVVPQARHVTLSACQHDESAFERGGKGIFTTCILEVLRRSGGAIHYADLLARARMMTQNQFNQTPEIYAIRNHENDLFRGFLDRPVTVQGVTAVCTCHPRDGWKIDLGAIHGLSTYSGPVFILDNEEKIEADIREIHASETLLDLPPRKSKHLDRQGAYAAMVSGFGAGNVTLFCDQQLDQAFVNAVGKWCQTGTGPCVLVTTLNQAQYVLRQDADHLLICRNDDQLRPVASAPLADPSVTDIAVRYLGHIAQWEHIRQLSNPEYQFTTYPVDLRILRLAPDGKSQELRADRDVIEFQYDKIGEILTGKLRVELTNQGDRKYYVALLYLSNTFQIYGNLLEGKVVGLDKEQSVWAYRGDGIEMDVEAHVIRDHHPYSVFYLKLLASPQPFDVSGLEQSALPVPDRGTSRGVGDVRGLKTRKEKAVKEQMWFTRTICLKGINPFYEEVQS